MIVFMAANGRVNKIGTKGARLYGTENIARRDGRSIVSFFVTLDGRMYTATSARRFAHAWHGAVRSPETKQNIQAEIAVYESCLKIVDTCPSYVVWLASWTIKARTNYQRMLKVHQQKRKRSVNTWDLGGVGREDFLVCCWYVFWCLCSVFLVCVLVCF